MKKTMPSREEFLSAIQTGSIVPLHAELDAGAVTPLSALHALRPLGHPVLLESARVNQRTGQYSFVTADPYLIFRSQGDTVDLNWTVAPEGKYGKRASLKRKPLPKLRELMANYRTARLHGLPPFTGGAVGYFSYEFVHQFEKLPRTALDDLAIPEACFLFVDLVVAFDHIADKAWLIVNPGAREQEMGFRKPEPDQWGRLYDEAAERIKAAGDRLAAFSGDPIDRHRAGTGNSGIRLEPALTQQRFETMVRRCKEYIAAGDIYQANLSQRFSAKIGDRDPLRLYEVLREINPSPFAVYAELGGLTVVSSSPERLVRLSGRVTDTRPIAGTRRRGKDVDETRELTAELLTNEKERAEHIMLLDLERNDLGKVCAYGTVAVDELMVVEDYSHVIHIVSNVRGELARGRDGFDLIRAAFPGGTITGVPKVRCMEIIDELEPVARGLYTGSLGYLANTGDLDLNIIIRTFVIRDNVAYAQTGAGIVADSDPAREYAETLEKAEALAKALEKW
jgi:aminodeoxychorismate synthase component I